MVIKTILLMRNSSEFERHLLEQLGLFFGELLGCLLMLVGIILETEKCVVNLRAKLSGARKILFVNKVFRNALEANQVSMHTIKGQTA